MHNPVQPIAITNVLNYLQGCLEHDAVKGETFDIGGPEVLTYRRLFDIYAEEAGLRHRLVIPVPVLTPRLSSYWIHLVTPLPAAIGRPLAEGLRTPVVCQENRLRDIIPQELLTCRETIRRALMKIQQQRVDTCWMDAGAMLPPEWLTCGDAPYAGGTILSCGFRVVIDASPAEVWPVIARIGGKTGYYFGTGLWRLRALADRLVGGVGFRGGRRHPEDLAPGDALDFWRVLAVEPRRPPPAPGRNEAPRGGRPGVFPGLRLRWRHGTAPGSPVSPRGLGGILYWYALIPLHHWIYRGMLRAVARAGGKTHLFRTGANIRQEGAAWQAIETGTLVGEF